MDRRVRKHGHGVDGSFLGDCEVDSLLVPPDHWVGQYTSFSSAESGCLKGGNGGLQADHHLLGMVLKRDCANFAVVVHLRVTMPSVSRIRGRSVDLGGLPTEQINRGLV